MVKFFCDVCEKDITDYANSRMVGEKGALKVEVITSINGVWNGGHVCVDCIREALAIADVKRKTKLPAPPPPGNLNKA